jgi:hypothetical protein
VDWNMCFIVVGTFRCCYRIFDLGFLLVAGFVIWGSWLELSVAKEKGQGQRV